MTGGVGVPTSVHAKARKGLVSRKFALSRGCAFQCRPWGFPAVPPHPHPIVLPPVGATCSLPASAPRIPRAFGTAGENWVEERGCGLERRLEIGVCPKLCVSDVV